MMPPGAPAPAAPWQDRRVATVLALGPGCAEALLRTWQAWRRDTRRCTRLHLVAVGDPGLAARPVPADMPPDLQPFAERLAGCGALPVAGWQRLVFPEIGLGEVVVTLALGELDRVLPALALEADAIHLACNAGDAPGLLPDDVGRRRVRGLARLARPGARLLATGIAPAQAGMLRAAGFVPDAGGTPGTFSAVYAPPSLGRRQRRKAFAWHGERRALVIGAGLAGAATCWSLARRGWQVALIDRADGPAAAASGLPLGLALPHVTRDDAPLSQLTRAGAAWLRQLVTLGQLDAHHWREATVEEVAQDGNLTPDRIEPGCGTLFEIAVTADGLPCRRFPHGLAVEGGALVRALLADAPGLDCRWRVPVTGLEYAADGNWVALDDRGERCATAPLAIVAAGIGAAALADPGAPGLEPVRGQITLGDTPPPPGTPAARTGCGHFLQALHPDAGWRWSMGATFERGTLQRTASRASDAENLRRLRLLAPETAAALAPQFEHGAVRAFVGLRNMSPDHLPLAGSAPDLAALAGLDAGRLAVDDIPARPGLYLLTALGARGLATGPICAELLASQLDGDPWPLPRALATALAPGRLALRRQRSAR